MRALRHMLRTGLGKLIAVLVAVALATVPFIVRGICSSFINDNKASYVDIATSAVGDSVSGLLSDASILTPATVVRVVDGDTFVASINGADYTVRLIGVDTPESVNPDETKNTSEGEAASVHTKEVLTEGRAVWLQKDTSDTDKYDRLLRYVWLEEPADSSSADEVKAKMLNAQLVADGWAEPLTIEPDTRWASLFESLAGER